jgi:hypothetical protein
MKVLLDINDKKAPFVMELLNSLSFVKAKELTGAKFESLEGLAEAIRDVKLAKKGKAKLKSLDQLLNEL